MVSLWKIMRVLGAVALVCVAIGLFGSGVLGPVIGAFLLLNAFLLFGTLIWS